MSDDRTIRIGPEGPDRSAQRRNARLGTIVAVVLAAVILGLFALRSGDDQEAAAPLPSSPASAPATDEATTAPSTAPSEQPSTATEPTAREPSEAGETTPTTGDVTTFLDSYEAEHGDDATTRIADLDGDEVDEILAARVSDDSVQIDVAAWDGTQYSVTFSDTGGAAQRLDDIVVRDVNGVEGLELITFQSAGEQGSSISVWGRGADGRYRRQDAVGGCWDGSNTFGIVGATVADGRLEATCDGSPLPPEAWPSDVYQWRSNAWAYVETVEPQQ